VHAAYNHAFLHQLRSLCDIRETLALYGRDLDWGTFSSTAAAWGATKGVYLALRLCADLLAAEVPGSILAAFEPPGFDPLVLGWARSQLFSSDSWVSPNFNRFVFGASHLERLRALFTALFPSRKVLSLVYGVSPRSWHLPFLYLRHAADILARYSSRAGVLFKPSPGQAEVADSSLSLAAWLGIDA
jgi:hypothetical protein